ncbi:MAG: cob(I)yrinic acid a,c-diamide adenosyltransferase [Lachnospiraceae bacterium]|nr:cob(I)yrinic acid a,c-diamide adenosyltransferase [Lachnospiraceae bacterium]
MVHVYCGNGKGKSTTSIGLCARAAGNDIPVLLVQFLKDDTSGELKVLNNLSNVQIMHSDKFFGFTWNMTEAELKEQAEIFDRMLGMVSTWIDEKLQEVGKLTEVDQNHGKKNGIKLLVILDEIIPAIDCKLVEESVLFKLMDSYNMEDVEFVLTGRNPSEELKSRADYISCIEAVRHPYEKGITARQGVEY